MTSLVLGTAGAIVGNMLLPGIGGSLGFMAGSLLGSLVDPPKSEGPRLSDLKLQKASYGLMIPIVWGHGRMSGIVIDQTDLTEHAHKSGGKGGPQVTNYTYTASFAILLCQTPVFGEPALSMISRIWWNGRLIWDVAVSAEGMPCTFYDGSDDQMPDPTFEAVHSPDPVPAYRGYAYVVFTDYDLTDGGNTIGQWEFEVGTGASGPIPWRVSTYERIHGLSLYCGIADNGDGTTTINYLDWISGTASPAGRTVEVRQLDATGTLISTTPTSLATWNGHYVSEATVCRNNPHITEITSEGSSPTYGAWYYDNVEVAHPISGGTHAQVVAEQCIFYNDQVYTTGMTGGGSPAIRRYPSPGGVTSGTSTLGYTLPGYPTSIDWAIAVDEDGFVYAWNAHSPLEYKLYKFTADLNLDTIYDTGVPGISHSGFAVWNGLICYERSDGDGSHWAAVYRIDPAGFVFVGELQLDETTGAPGVIGLGNGLVSVRDGILSLVPPATDDPIPLSVIVGNLSDMTQAAPVRDVTELEPILVNWYAVASQMTVRNAIQPLRQAFFFDAVESDDLIKFRLRDGASIATIPDDDLCAHAYGEDPGTPLKTVRKKELDLPRNVTFTYIDIDADYQEGAQSAPRQTTMSQSDVSVQVPIGFTAAEAAQRCNTLQATEWIERETFEWSTSRKWAKLEPCDIVTVRGRDIRIQTRTEQPDGVIKWTGVLSAAEIYSQATTGDPGHFVPQEPPPPPQLTQLQVLDIPLITDPARQNVYEAAMAGAERPAWRGASLQRSVDGGTTYSELINSLEPDIIGSTDDVLFNFTGGNVVDEVNAVNVTIGPGGGELSSTTYEGILNGVNEFLIGSEILNARDAVLVTGSTYKLTGLLRGRRGTEWAMVTHVVDERFIVLPVNELAYQTTDVGVTRQYKAVTNGSTLATATAQDVTLRGVSLTPYSPVLLGAGTNAAGDWILQWVRRARVNGAWLNFTDVPLDEPTEQYRVTLWSDALYTTIITTIDCSAPTLTLTVAEQTVLFGSPQSELFWAVAQIGRLGPGYDSGGHAPTIVTPPPTTPPPATGVPPPGVQWHEDFVFTGGKHADLNANYLMATFGSSWCWTYKVNSAAASYLDGEVVAVLGATERSRINFSFLPWSGGNYAPAGTLIPWGTNIVTGPVLHADVPLVDIPLPYPDDAL